MHPLGLAAKGSVWYLFADTDAGLRTFRVDRMTSVEPTGEPVSRPDDFDLTETWRRFVDSVDHLRTPLLADATVDPALLPHLRTVLGTRVAIGGPEPDGRIRVELRGHAVRSLVAEIAGFGTAVEVHGPPELRAALPAVGHDLVTAYGEQPTGEAPEPERLRGEAATSGPARPGVTPGASEEESPSGTAAPTRRRPTGGRPSTARGPGRRRRRASAR